MPPALLALRHLAECSDTCAGSMMCKGTPQLSLVPDTYIHVHVHVMFALFQA